VYADVRNSTDLTLVVSVEWLPLHCSLWSWAVDSESLAASCSYSYRGDSETLMGLTLAFTVVPTGLPFIISLSPQNKKMKNQRFVLFPDFILCLRNFIFSMQWLGLVCVIGVQWLLVMWSHSLLIRCLRFFGFVIRCIGNSYLIEPWWVSSLELLYGFLTFDWTWAAGVHHASDLAPDSMHATGQVLFSGLSTGNVRRFRLSDL
jgi:hypothetical protein